VVDHRGVCIEEGTACARLMAGWPETSETRRAFIVLRVYTVEWAGRDGCGELTAT